MSQLLLPAMYTPVVPAYSTGVGAGAHVTGVSGLHATGVSGLHGASASGLHGAGALHLSASASHALVTAAAGIGAAVAGAAVTVLVARAAARGAAAGADALIRIDAQMAADQARFRCREEEALLWQAVTTETVGRRAELATLTARLRRLGGDPAGLDPPQPPPQPIAGSSPCDLDAWCAQADLALPALRAAVAGREQTAQARLLAAAVAPFVPAADAEALAADALAAHATREAPPPVPSSTATAPPAVAVSPAVTTSGGTLSAAARDRLRGRVTAKLRLLPSDATDADNTLVARLVGEVFERAERAARGPHGGGHPLNAASDVLSALEAAVRTAAERADRRRADARAAAKLLDVLTGDAAGGRPEPPRPDEGLLRRLAAVVAGDADLDEATAAEAEQARADLEAAALRQATLDWYRSVAERAGCTVDEETRAVTTSIPGLTLRRAGWDSHHLRLLFPARGEVNALVVRHDGAPASEETGLADDARCAEGVTVATRMFEIATGDAAGNPARTGAGASRPIVVNRTVQREEAQVDDEDEILGGAPLAREARP